MTVLKEIKMKKSDLTKNNYKFSSKKYSIVLYSCLILLLGCFSVVFYMQTFVFKSQSSLMYKEKSIANYTVNLKNNDYYDKNSLSSGMSYIASLIKNIDVTFDYNFISSEELKYKTTYSVDAITRVYDDTDKKEVLYEKTEKLVKDKTISKDKLMHNDFSQNVVIDYQHFNDFVKSFKTSYGLTSSSDLTIILNVKTNAESDKFSNKIDIDSTSSLVIPLTEQTINIKMDSNDIDNYKTIYEDRGIKDINIKYLVAFILSILLELFFVISLIKTIVSVLKERSKYDITLKRLLKDYDSIIGNAQNKIDETGYKVLNMSSFEELRDIHDNLGTPIIYNEIKEHKLAEFVIINDNIIYKYILDEKDVCNGGKGGKKKK